MRMTISPERAKELKPQYGEILGAMARKAGTMVDPGSVTWYLDWAIRATAYSAAQVFGGVARRDRAERDALSPQERLDERLSRVVGACLMAEAAKGHPALGNRRLASFSATTALCRTPDEIVALIREAHDKDEAERERIERLRREDPEALNAEINGLLGKLGRDPGFVALQATDTKKR